LLFICRGALRVQWNSVSTKSFARSVLRRKSLFAHRQVFWVQHSRQKRLFVDERMLRP